jgi:hypothetical protein
MIIDSANTEVAALLLEWRSLVHEKEDDKSVASLVFQRVLARSVMAPVLGSFPGELVLAYHQFLSQHPTGAHSFAFGSEMVWEDTYVTLVGRMNTDVRIVETPEERHVIGRDARIQHMIITPPQFLLPTEWWVQLWPRYRHSNTPTHYALEQSEKQAAEFLATPLDLSWFGQHLFPVRAGKHDWARQMTMVFGNDSVREWLHGHGSDGLASELLAR